MSKKELLSSKGKNIEAPLFVEGTNDILRTYKTIRIAVSGDITLNKVETDIIDTADFQRLRGIKELGTTYLVYPTAVHTRFDHSLGTLSMACDMMRAIRENKHNSPEERMITSEQEILIRLLALLHDIGHIPFGHTIEDEFCIFPRHDKDPERVDRFLGKDSAIGKLLIQRLGYDLYNRFMKIYTVEKAAQESLEDDLFAYDLVNNTVCADLLDYLRRDCYFCNVILDMDYRFLKYLYIRPEGRVKRLVVRLWKEGKATPRRDLLNELVRLLDNRYLLGERVYFHHAKLITGAMIAGAVQRAKMEGEIKKEMLYDMGDETLLDRLQKSKAEPVRKLANSIRERKIWKSVFERKRNMIDTEQSDLRDLNVMETLMKDFWQNATNRTDEEDRIAALLGMEPGDVLFYCPDHRMAMKLAEMKVFWNGRLKPLESCKDDKLVAQKLENILASHQNLWSIKAFVNPEFISKKEKINVACEYLFTFEKTHKGINQKAHYGNVIDEFAQRMEFRGIPHDQYELKKEAAIERLVSATHALRDKRTVEEIIKDAFA